MFKVITVEREYGAGGSLVAAELARRKGWQLFDQQLTCEIAKLAAIDERTVASREERCDPLMHRLARVFWRGSHERALPIAEDKIFGADEMVQLATTIIEKKGELGDCVIVGRGAPYILRNRADTFRVFVYGSRAAKLQRLVSLNMDENYASEMVDTIDAERSAFIRRYFGQQWPCRQLYHVMLNSDMGIEFVTNTILATMEAMEHQQSLA